MIRIQILVGTESRAQTCHDNFRIRQYKEGSCGTAALIGELGELGLVCKSVDLRVVSQHPVGH